MTCPGRPTGFTQRSVSSRWLRRQAAVDAACLRNGSTVAARRSGVDATATSRATAPRSATAAPAALNVEPVVTTSSTTKTLRPRRPGRATNFGPSRRCARDRPVWDTDESRSSNRRHGTPSCLATALASNSPWSNPRSRRRFELVGAHVTTSISCCAPSSSRRLTMSPPRCRLTARRLRYFKPSTTLRARPVNGKTAITPCGWSRGGAASSAKRQVVQMVAPGLSQPAQRVSKIMYSI
jgi:hypothetical protein